MSIGQAVRNHALARPGETALFDERRSVTWVQFDQRTTRLANALVDELAVGLGEAVAVLAHNRSEVVELLVGCEKAGAVYVGLNFRMTPEELDLALDNAEPRVIVAGAEYFDEARQVAAHRDIACVGLDDDGPDGYESLLAAASTRARPARSTGPDELACIVYTSGTTGAPKGVAFAHRVVTQHAAVAAIEYEITAASRYLVQIPHNSSVNITIAPCLLMGATIGFADSRGFDPDRFAATVHDAAVTHTFLVPTQLVRLLDQLDPADGRLGTLVTLGYGSSPIAPDRLRDLVERLGPIFIQLYGMAEIASIGTLLRKSDHVAALSDRPELLRSAGRPSLAIDVAIRDDDGRDVAIGERGEIVFAGHHVMAGYHRDPARTAESLVHGWMHSGDIGHFDELGYLYVVDRKKDIIIRGGQNLSPTEIENALYTHPAVLDAAAVGAPDPEWGERVVAIVALTDGAGVTAEDLLTHVAGCGLPRYTRPEEIHIEASLPKNAVGKIDKKALRNGFWTAERHV